MSTDQINEQQTTPEPGQETAQESPPAIDMDVLMSFVGQVVGDLGATISAGNVLIGEKLGLYRALASAPDRRRPVSPWRHGHRPALRRGSGCAARLPAATWSTTPRPRRTR